MFQINGKFAGSASKWCAKNVRDSYLQCVFANEHFHGIENKRSTSTSIKQTKSCTEHGNAEYIGISDPSWCVTIIALEIAIASTVVAR